MTCCIVGFLILAAVGRVRRTLGLTRAADEDAATLFAPVAWRPAAGEAPRAPAEPGTRARRGNDAVLTYCAVGIAGCLVGIPALVVSGAAHNTGSAWLWLLRGACYLAVIVAALRLRRSVTIWSAPNGAGTALMVVGAVIFELGVLDMHAFRLFSFGPNLIASAVFHNVGPAVAMAGGVALLYGSRGRSTTSRRSSRSTLTSAHPSSSAVTASSTPPITT